LSVVGCRLRPAQRYRFAAFRNARADNRQLTTDNQGFHADPS